MRGSESISLQLGKEGRHISVRPSRVVDALWAWAAGTTAGPADLAPRLTDASGKALKDAALRYGLAPFRLVEPRDGYVLVMDPARHQMPE